MLFCEGRIDFQVKLHGHRIELEDIDNNLLKNTNIRVAATVPSYENGKIKSLVTFIVYNKKVEQRFAEVKDIKNKLKQLVPGIHDTEKNNLLRRNAAKQQRKNRQEKTKGASLI